MGKQEEDSLTFVDFVRADDKVPSSNAITNDEIFAQHIRNNLDSQDDDEDNDNYQPPQLISLKQARSHIAELSYFCRQETLTFQFFPPRSVLKM